MNIIENKNKKFSSSEKFLHFYLKLIFYLFEIVSNIDNYQLTLLRTKIFPRREIFTFLFRANFYLGF